MTTDDFFLLFVAFGGFVILPALLFWAFARVADRKQSVSRDPRTPPDIGSRDASGGEGRKEAARSRANEFLRRLSTGIDRRALQSARLGSKSRA
jgi:hypothetical protein